MAHPSIMPFVWIARVVPGASTPDRAAPSPVLNLTAHVMGRAWQSGGAIQPPMTQVR